MPSASSKLMKKVCLLRIKSDMMRSICEFPVGRDVKVVEVAVCGGSAKEGLGLGER